MRAPTFVILVHQRDHDRSVRPAPCVAEGEIGFGTDRLTVMIAEAQRVDERRGMLDFTVETNDRGLAIGFDSLARPPSHRGSSW
jgi:hypothetical protein